MPCLAGSTYSRRNSYSISLPWRRDIDKTLPINTSLKSVDDLWHLISLCTLIHTLPVLLWHLCCRIFLQMTLSWGNRRLFQTVNFQSDIFKAISPVTIIDIQIDINVNSWMVLYDWSRWNFTVVSWPLLCYWRRQCVLKMAVVVGEIRIGVEYELCDVCWIR